MTNEWWIHELIQIRAYYLWVEAGCPANGELDFWLQAEKEILKLYERKSN
jgi:hypothetical protein